jgi:hypothetical protein
MVWPGRDWGGGDAMRRGRQQRGYEAWITASEVGVWRWSDGSDGTTREGKVGNTTMRFGKHGQQRLRLGWPGCDGENGEVKEVRMWWGDNAVVADNGGRGCQGSVDAMVRSRMSCGATGWQRGRGGWLLAEHCFLPLQRTGIVASQNKIKINMLG